MKKFVVKHWNGEFSLPISYWAIGTVLGTALILSTSFLVGMLDTISPSITYTGWLVILMYLVIWAVMLWIYVGVWKSSSNYVAAGKSKIWGGLAKVGVVFGLLQLTTEVINVHIPVIGEMSKFIMGSDPMGTVKYEVLDEGRTLYVTGVFGNRSSSIVLDALNKNPSVTRLHLDSRGGRFKEVVSLSREIQNRKLETYVEGRCLSFCTVIFLSGVTRYSTPNAQIGFHSPIFTGKSHIDSDLMEPSKALYRSFSLPDSFINKIFSTPNSEMWYPSYQELIEFGVITDLTLGGESNKLKSTLNVASVEDLKHQLLSYALWRKYENKFPGIVNEVSALMFDSFERGQADSDVLNESRKYTGRYTSKAIAKSTPHIRLSYAALAVDQVRHVSTLGPKFCGAFLAMELDVTKALPKALVEREMNIIQEALDSRFEPPINYSEGLLEQYLAEALVDLTEAEIAAVSDQSAKPSQATCSGMVKFFEGIAALPKAQGDLVIYRMLSQ